MSIGRSTLAVSLAAVALVVAACGGSETAAPAPAPTPAPAPAPAPAEPEANADDFYVGKTITIVVPFGAGGGVDFNARFLAEWLPRYLNGSPTVQVINVPGAAGVIGGNQFELLTERDGLTLFLSGSSNLINEQLRVPQVEYRTADWQPLLGIPSGGVASLRLDSGVEPDLSNLGDLELFTGMRAKTGVDTMWLLAYAALGLDFAPIFGFGGAGDTRVAFEQGETDLDWQSTGAYENNVQPLHDQGLSRALFAAGTRTATGLTRHAPHPEVPTIEEVYEEAYGTAPSGPLWDAYLNMNSVVLTAQRLLWLHTDDPADAITAMDNAIAKMAADPEFLAAIDEILGGFPVYFGDEVRALAPTLQIGPTEFATITGFLAGVRD